MEDKKKIPSPWIKKGPLKTFLFFLAFSAVVWFFVQFSKQYSEIVEFPINYINVPKDKILLNDSPEILRLRMRDNGINIAFRKLFPQELLLDVSEAVVKDGQLIYNLEQQKASLLTQLNIGYDDITFLQEALKIGFDQRAVKTLAVQPNIELGFAVGYSALEGIKLEPDSVTVSGPGNILDTLEVVSTKNLKINNISRDVKGVVDLDTDQFPKLTFYQQQVGYSLLTDKFTEGKAEIPVELINVPQGTNVTIFPKNVTVFYQVSLSEFEKVKPAQFKVVADFKNAMKTDGYMLAQVVKKPDLVNNVRLNEQQIQFVIKR